MWVTVHNLAAMVETKIDTEDSAAEIERLVNLVFPEPEL